MRPEVEFPGFNTFQFVTSFQVMLNRSSNLPSGFYISFIFFIENAATWEKTKKVRNDLI